MSILSSKHCPSCGKVEQNGEFIRNFCPDCFAQRHQLYKLPPEITAKRCAVCGKVFRFTTWQEENKQLLTEIVESKLKSLNSAKIIEIKFQSSYRKNCFDVRLTIEATVDGEKIKQNDKTTLCFEQTQCLICSREAGGFYDSIIQLRPAIEKGEELNKEKLESMEKIANQLVRLIEKGKTRIGWGQGGGRVTKITKDKRGFDIFVAGINNSLSATKKVSDDVTHTRKLVGRKDGKDLFRHTFCARV